jgi:hypothetical protein
MRKKWVWPIPPEIILKKRMEEKLIKHEINSKLLYIYFLGLGKSANLKNKKMNKIEK